MCVCVWGGGGGRGTAVSQRAVAGRQRRFAYRYRAAKGEEKDAVRLDPSCPACDITYQASHSHRSSLPIPN